MKTQTLSTYPITQLIEADLGPPIKRSGGWRQWRCPFHDDKNTPSLSVRDDNNRYFCFGCRASGDAINWLREFRGMTFQEAKRTLEGHAGQARQMQQKSIPAKAERLRPDELQSAWKEVMGTCAAHLHSPVGANALDYLHKRGLEDRTIFSPFHRLGYSPGQKIAGIWVERGIVIPCFSTKKDLSVDYVHYIKIRRPAEDPKYRKLNGQGSDLSGLYGAGWLRGANAIFLTEGEFDCLLLHQEAGDLVGVATLGSASDRFNFARFGYHLLGAAHVFVVYDNDRAGERGASYWQGLSDRVHIVQVPAAKDITEYWQHGGNLARWVMGILNEYKITDETDDWFHKAMDAQAEEEGG